MTDDMSWDEVADRIGHSTTIAIDRAITGFLAMHEGGIKQSDYYLVSEGLAYAVCKALIEDGSLV